MVRGLLYLLTRQFRGRGSTLGYIGIISTISGRTSLAFTLGVLLCVSATAQARGDRSKLAGFRPAWSSNYQVAGRGALNRQPNLTYLSNRNGARAVSSATDAFSEQLERLFDPGQAAAWRKQYEAMNETYEKRRNAGLGSPTHDAAYQGSIISFRDGIQEETKKYKIRQGEVAAVGVAKKIPYSNQIAIPGIILAGVYIGRPVNWRVTDESRFSFRTSIRDRFGAVELHSPFLFGSFEVHPQAADRYTLWGSPGVDFGKAMDFGHVVDFASERYQFKIARSVPFIDLNSFLLYGSSSNTVTGSLSKQLTPSLSAAVDSVYYLTPYAADHTTEERVRLKYSVNF